MRVTVIGKNINVTPALKEIVEKRFQRWINILNQM